MQTPIPDRQNLDFRALEVFRLVYRMGSFSAAADVLDSSQSNVSYVIGKLRKVVGDPLFLKTAQGVEPTEKAHEVFEFADSMLKALDDLVHVGPFDPASATQSVVLSCNHYQRELIVPALFARLDRDAPHLKLSILTAADLGPAQLRQGEADMLICPRQRGAATLHSIRLLNETYACVMASDSGWDTTRLSLQDYLSAPHVTVRYGAGWRSGYQQELDARGLSLNEVHVVPSPSDLNMLLPGTQRMSTLPTRQAHKMGDAFRVLPSPLPAPFEVRLYWASRTHKSPLHMWLRAVIREIARTLEP
ncbi:MAG: LysR family transcriptional regulator [Pseudomonadota bacterium]